MEVRRLGPAIGAEVRGIDVKALDDAGFAAVYRAWLDANVLVIREQKLEIDEFLRYSRRFGLVHPHPSKSTRHPDVPEVTLLGVDKFGADGTLNMAIYRRGAEGWHTDGAYDDEPFKATQLFALAIPSRGGDTSFASMYAAGAGWRAAGARSPMAAGVRAPRSSTRRIATGRPRFIPSSARIRRRDVGRSTSIRARSSTSRGCPRRRAMK